MMHFFSHEKEHKIFLKFVVMCSIDWKIYLNNKNVYLGYH